MLDAVRSGKTLAIAGALIGVTRERAGQFCARWGENNRTIKPISEEELATAMKLYKRGMPLRHIACQIKRWDTVVGEALVREGVHVKTPREPLKRWTKARARKLQSLLKDHSFQEAADRMGISVGAALGKAHRMGLCNPCGYT